MDKEKAVADKGKTLLEKNTALQEKDRKIVINAYKSGLDNTIIQTITQLDLKIIENIIAELE